MPVATIAESSVSLWDEFSGRLEAVERVDVRSRVAGAVKSVHFTEGALVKRDDLLFTLSASIGVAVFLLLFMGSFGHNLFRFTWLWYGGFLIVARYCAARRLVEGEAEFAEEPAFDECVPAGWVVHSPH